LRGESRAASAISQLWNPWHGRVCTAARLLGLLSALLAPLAATGPATADSPPLVLDGPARDSDLQGHIDYLLEPGNVLEPHDFVGPNAVEMAPVTSAWPDFGYVSDRVWLRLDIVNAAQAAEWRLHVRENFMQEFTVFAVHQDGRVDALFETDRQSAFHDRPVGYPEMVAPLRLERSEAVTLLIRYRSEGTSYLAFAIETLESFSAVANERIAKGYVFYGMIILLITVALIALALFRRRIFAAYAAYATAALLYIMHGDGVAFQMLWPNWPEFNSMASVVTGSGIIVFGAIYARVFLETPRYHPVLDRVLLAIIAVTLGLDAALWFTFPQLLKQLLVAFSMVAIVTFAITGIIAARTRFREVRFYVVAWLGVVVSAAILNGRHMLGLEISKDAQYDSMRAALVFDALMMGLAIADRYNTLRLSRRAALDASLAQARENAQLAGRLAQLGERHAQARALARDRGEILENTVHDLRQPMQGLRLSLQGLGDVAMGAAERRYRIGQFEESLSYMERLVEARIADGEAAQPEADTKPVSREMGAHAVLHSVRDMFAAEAEAKGLDLRLRLATGDRMISDMALMRIVSNLVSNAIKFTHEGRVLIGLRPAGSGLRIEVHDDGPGLSEAEFAQARKRNVRLSETSQYREGSGLGLAIADEIAAGEGWLLTLARRRPSGTSIFLSIPAETLGDTHAPGAADERQSDLGGRM